VVALLVMLPGTAKADALSTFGWDPEAARTLGSDVALGRSTSVIFANPALLADVDDEVRVGFLVATPRLQVRLMDKPPRADVSRSIFDSSIATDPGATDRPLPTIELANARRDTTVSTTDSRLTIGVANSFGLERFRFGVLLSVPAGGSDAANVRTHYDDEREGTFSNRLWFTRFGETNRIASVIAGGSVQPVKWLSFGIGVQLAASAIARLKVYVPDATVQDHAESNLETSVSTSWRTILGVRGRCPVAPISIGLVWRAESAFHVDAASEVTLWNDHETDPTRTIPRRTTQNIPMVFGFEPMEVALGAAYDDARFDVRAAATFQRWSHFVDNHGTSPQDAALVPGVAVDASAFRFKDVIALSASVGLHATKWLDFSLAGTYQPSPVPPQVGRTSFVDSDTLGVALGEHASFTIAGKKFSFAIAVQLWRMLPRTVYKDPKQTVDAFPDSARTLKQAQPMPEAAGLQTNSPGYPGYRVEGWLRATSFSLAHHF